MTTMESQPPVKFAVPLDRVEYKLQLRLGIQGMPKSGKTWASLTFKKPVVGSFDRGLISHIGRPDVYEIPFYDSRIFKDRKEGFINWVRTEGIKLTNDYTFIVDGGTGLQAAFHLWYRLNPDITDRGQENKFAQWRWKIDYFTEIAFALKDLQCDVVYISHEAPDRNDKGEPNGMIRPLLSGSFVDELQSHFTDWFRAIVIPKPENEERLKALRDKFLLDPLQAKEWINSTPINCQQIYLWQTQPDDKTAGCGTSLVGCPKYVVANASVFTKYKRKVEVNG